MDSIIQTKRLSLRRPNLTDTKSLAALLNNYEVASNLAQVSLPYSENDTRLWLPRMISATHPDKSGFVIDHPDSGVVGMISFRPESGCAVLGYWLGEPFWGKGYMSEAVTAAITWYFNNTKADIVLSGVFHFNMASLAIQYKLGFVEIGRSSRPCLARNQDLEHIDTELTRDAFEAAIL